MPERIQLRRIKGWRKPEGAIVVARPTVWGNPWRPADYRHYWSVCTTDGVSCWTAVLPETRSDAQQIAVGYYRSWLTHGTVVGHTRPRLDRLEHQRQRILNQLPTLRGHDLCCWCSDGTSCHADVLLDLANQEARH